MADKKEKQIKESTKENKQEVEKSINKKSNINTTPKKRSSTKNSTSKTYSTTNKKTSTSPNNTTKTQVNHKQTNSKYQAKTANKSSTARASSNKKRTSKSISNKDSKKIESSKATKKSKKTDNKIKQIIAEQLENVERIGEIEKIPIKEKKKKTALIDEKKIAQQIETAKKMPKEAKREIYKNMVTNIFIGILITLYFIALSLGFINIDSTTYITDLKVFSIEILAITIILFEYAYNKDSAKFALIGIDTLFVAIVTIILLYIFILYQSKYLRITCICSCVAVVYYLIKSALIYIRDKYNWKKSISDVKEIISEE